MSFTYKLPKTIKLPGRICHMYDVVFMSTNGVVTIEPCDLAGKNFKISSQMRTIFNPDSPLNTPESSPKTTPKKDQQKKLKKRQSYATPAEEKLQYYCLAQMEESQILYDCEIVNPTSVDINGFNEFTINERNHDARERIYEIKIDFDGPVSLGNNKLLRFGIKFVDGKGEDVRGYAKVRDELDVREDFSLLDEIKCRAWGDLEVDFEEWGIKQAEGESEEDLIARARKLWMSFDDASTVDVEV